MKTWIRYAAIVVLALLGIIPVIAVSAYEIGWKRAIINFLVAVFVCAWAAFMGYLAAKLLRQ